MHVHFIAIGGSAMHNLAIALHKKGIKVSGSDDEIFEPASSHLSSHGLLPEKTGWFPEKINPGIDAVILGMHAFADNPELLRAKELGLKIYSYPEYTYEQTREKTRVVVGGSHGKTTITAMIMHVLKQNGRNFDYLVGAALDDFDTMVKLSNDAPVAVFEGDEYLASTLDPRPKFHLYRPTIGIISGIAWDHINVFPTFENYKQQFSIFAQAIPHNGTLIYCAQDKHVQDVATQQSVKARKIGYAAHPYKIVGGVTYLLAEGSEWPLKIFGEHNMQNISAAKAACNLLGIDDEAFYGAITSFRGAAKRLQLLAANESTSVFLDFAHSPSKLKATVDAVKQNFPNRKLVACMELHTFSSLNENFLEQYRDTMETADEAWVYYNPQSIEHKRLKAISPEQVKQAFGKESLKVTTNSEEIRQYLLAKAWTDTNVLLMTSGNFSGIDLKKLATEVTSKG